MHCVRRAGSLALRTAGKSKATKSKSTTTKRATPPSIRSGDRDLVELSSTFELSYGLSDKVWSPLLTCLRFIPQYTKS